MKVTESARVIVLRWIKFNAVGGMGIGVQLCILALLRSGAQIAILPATVLAVEAAVLHNFFWHQRFTWKDRRTDESTLLRFLKFNCTTGAFSIAGNILIVGLLTATAGLNYFFADCIAITVCSLGNFLVNDRFTFRAEGAK